MTDGRTRTTFMQWTLILLLAVYSLFPVYMMTVLSLKTAQEDVAGNPFFVRHPNFEWYLNLFEPSEWVRGELTVPIVPYLVWVKNTAIAFTGSLALTLLASLMAAYAIGRLHPPGWRWWRRALFASYLIPQTLIFLPMYLVVLRLHIDDSLLALILIYPMLTVPFCVWLLSAYFQRLSPEIEESAYIEGANRWTAFVRIILPMSWPVIVAAGIFTLGIMSSDTMFASVFLPNQFHQTLAAGLSTMDVGLEDLTVIAGVNMAALTIVPIHGIFAGAFVRGLTAAMVEGA
ncbi:MAG: carbohydrate ABC transporter permease [Bacillati bacterium ANGP1]|uniref:Carbohydrate ABC transporter permease n=1 Tax=Candidatus Segetimicrobium genomatis TaxID=2569760 RepID=A0A537J6D8_9BACT|nr:MAG: carbohydrate ABC transporter permease [Terrabacteria group bacterium ANGP1]